MDDFETMNAKEKWAGARLLQVFAFLRTLYKCYDHLKKELQANRVMGCEIYSAKCCTDKIEALLDSVEFPPGGHSGGSPGRLGSFLSSSAPVLRSPSQASVSSPKTAKPGEAPAGTEEGGSQRSVATGEPRGQRPASNQSHESSFLPVRGPDLAWQGAAPGPEGLAAGEAGGGPGLEPGTEGGGSSFPLADGPGAAPWTEGSGDPRSVGAGEVLRAQGPATDYDSGGPQSHGSNMLGFAAVVEEVRGGPAGGDPRSFAAEEAHGRRPASNYSDQSHESNGLMSSGAEGGGDPHEEVLDNNERSDECQKSDPPNPQKKRKLHRKSRSKGIKKVRLQESEGPVILDDEKLYHDYKDSPSHIDVIKKLPRREKEIFVFIEGRIPGDKNVKYLDQLFHSSDAEMTIEAFQMTRESYREAYGEDFVELEKRPTAGPTGGRGKDTVSSAVGSVKSSSCIKGMTWIFNMLCDFVQDRPEFR